MDRLYWGNYSRCSNFLKTLVKIDFNLYTFANIVWFQGSHMAHLPPNMAMIEFSLLETFWAGKTEGPENLLKKMWTGQPGDIHCLHGLAWAEFSLCRIDAIWWWRAWGEFNTVYFLHLPAGCTILSVSEVSLSSHEQAFQATMKHSFIT